MKKYISQDEINRRFEDKGKPHIKALSGSYGFEDTIAFNCEIHDYSWMGQLRSVLYKKYCCQKCCNEGRSQTMRNKHNLWDEAPETAKLLENPEDANGLARTSKCKRWFICPTCHARLYKSVVVVSTYGLSCNNCSDGFSFPNKVMNSILTQLKIDFIPEYSPSWIAPQRYDFYFAINRKKYVIEMDGGLGHGHKTFAYNENPLISLNRDVIKDEEAKAHHITVVRIDCTTSDIDFIRNNIENSILKDILLLDNIDWADVEKSSRSSLVKEICDYYRQYPFYSYKDLSAKFAISESTLRKYIKTGSQLGWCPTYTNSFGDYILCIESQMIFATAHACGKYYGIDSSCVIKACKGKRESVGQLHFIYLSDYKGNIDELVPNPNIKAITRDTLLKINIYDEFNNFIEQHPSKASIANKYKICEETVLKRCSKTEVPYKGMVFYYATDPNQPDKAKCLLV